MYPEEILKSIFYKSENSKMVVSYSIQPTVRDLDSLTYDDQIIFDKRKFSQYYKDYLMISQEIIHTFFYKSLKKPAFIRAMLLLTSQSLNFALNAIFYSDSVIEAVSLASQNGSSSIVY